MGKEGVRKQEREGGREGGKKGEEGGKAGKGKGVLLYIQYTATTV